MQVSAVYSGGRDHPIVGLYQGAPWRAVMPPDSGLGIGRYFRPDELEVLSDDAIDPTPADDPVRRARLVRELGESPESEPRPDPFPAPISPTLNEWPKWWPRLTAVYG